MPWMLSRRILRWRFAPPLPRPLPPFPPVGGVSGGFEGGRWCGWKGGGMG